MFFPGFAMKIVTHFCIVNAFLFSACSVTQGRFIAVSSLVGNENYYIEPWFIYNEEDELNFTLKADDCADVIGSALFDTLYQVDPVDPTDKTVYADLRENYPDIYANLYQLQNSTGEEEIVYTNAYRQLDSFVGKHKVHEQVISCLARERASQKIVEYFISRTHLLSIDRHHPDRSKGVFVLGKREKMTVIAVAEEPGFVVDPSDYDYYNISMSRFEIEVHTADKYDEGSDVEGTICGLSMHEKIRLCTLVANADKIREETIFVPNEDGVESGCYRGVIRSECFNDTLLNDWMVGCKLTTSRSRETKVYYISAGFHRQDYFICKEPHREKKLMRGVSSRINVPKRIRLPVKI